jgi:hypothetical protein
MRRIVGPVLFLIFLIEVAVAVIIVLNVPGGFGSLVAVDLGPERRRELPVKTFDNIDKNSRLVVENDNGRVEVTGSNVTNQIIVKATQVTHGTGDEAFNRLTFEAQQSGKDIVVKAKNNLGVVVGFGGSSRTDLLITVPTYIVTNLTTDNGIIGVSNLDNSEVQHIFQTDNGRIGLTNVKAKFIQAKSSNGLISLDTVTSRINAETDNGRIEALRSTLDIERVKSDNGSIDLRGSLQQTVNGEISTSNGSVRLRAEQVGLAKYDVTTSNGSININVPGLGFSRQERRHVTTTGNGQLIRINTDNGSVTIEQGS